MNTIEVMRKALAALEPRCGTNADERQPDGAITALRAELERLEAVEPACNPHPKAPHGFNRNASHSAGRSVCDCESWDPYEEGYQAGLLAGLAHDSAPIAPAIPALTGEDMQGHPMITEARALAAWAYALAAERAGVQIKEET